MRCLNHSILRGQLLASPHAEKLARLMSGEANYPCCFHLLLTVRGFRLARIAALRLAT